MSILSSTQRCSASDCLAYSTRISSRRIWRASSTSSPSLYSLPASLSSSMVSLMFWTRVCRENWRRGGQPASTAWLTRSVSLATPPSRPLSSSSYAANMLSLACTLAAESSPPSGASAVFSASATSASIFVEPLPVNDLPRVKALSCLSSLTSSDTKATAEPGTITPLSPGCSIASAVTEDADFTRFLLEPPPPKKLPTLSSIVPPTLFLRSRPAEEARVLRRGGSLASRHAHRHATGGAGRRRGAADRRGDARRGLTLGHGDAQDLLAHLQPRHLGSHPFLVLGRARVEDLDEQLDLLERLQPRLQLELVAVLPLFEVVPHGLHHGDGRVRGRVELAAQRREPHLERRAERLEREEVAVGLGLFGAAVVEKGLELLLRLLGARGVRLLGEELELAVGPARERLRFHDVLLGEILEGLLAADDVRDALGRDVLALVRCELLPEERDVRHHGLLVGAHVDHVLRIEDLGDAQLALRDVEGLVEVVELVGGLERLEVEQVGAEGVDQRVERHAVLPRRVEVGDVDRTVGALRHLLLGPLQQPLLSGHVALRALVDREAQDERPHHAQDELLVLVDDVLGGVGVLDADRGDEAVDVLDRQVDVLDLLDPRRRILVVLAERLLADVLHQLDQLDAVAEVRRQVRDCELVPLELQVDPRLEGLVLHALAHRLSLRSAS